ncbi:MAG: CPBP family intramembrane metalloprotease [Actinomycetia bacterium]|nr:CPBP family intramembrane metalloprotease [Actinomycetes bacterium]
MRIQPSPKWAIGIGVLYAPVFVGLVALSGISYSDVASSTSNALRAIIIPLALVAVLLAGLTSWLGWWRPTLSEKTTTPHWFMLAPILFVVVVLISTNYARILQTEVSFMLVLAVASLLIGFCEELVYRGLVVVGLRARSSELKVWFFSTLLFSLLHAWNILLGQDLGDTVGQLVFTFVVGSGLYAARRCTGYLIVPILLHAAWDWTIFVGASEVLADSSETLSGDSTGAFKAIGLLILLILSLWSILIARKYPSQTKSAPPELIP